MAPLYSHFLSRVQLVAAGSLLTIMIQVHNLGLFYRYLGNDTSISSELFLTNIIANFFYDIVNHI